MGLPTVYDPKDFYYTMEFVTGLAQEKMVEAGFPVSCLVWEFLTYEVGKDD